MWIFFRMGYTLLYTKLCNVCNVMSISQCICVSLCVWICICLILRSKKPLAWLGINLQKRLYFTYILHIYVNILRMKKTVVKVQKKNILLLYTVLCEYMKKEK